MVFMEIEGSKLIFLFVCEDFYSFHFFHQNVVLMRMVFQKNSISAVQQPPHAKYVLELFQTIMERGWGEGSAPFVFNMTDCHPHVNDIICFLVFSRHFAAEKAGTTYPLSQQTDRIN